MKNNIQVVVNLPALIKEDEFDFFDICREALDKIIIISSKNNINPNPELVISKDYEINFVGRSIAGRPDYEGYQNIVSQKLLSNIEYKEVFMSDDHYYAILYSPILTGKYLDIEELWFLTFDSLNDEVKSKKEHNKQNLEKIVHLDWDFVESLISFESCDLSEEKVNKIYERWKSLKMNNAIKSSVKKYSTEKTINPKALKI